MSGAGDHAAIKRRCTFCNQAEEGARVLVGGGTALICDECVEIASRAVAEIKGTSYPEATRPEAPAVTEPPYVQRDAARRRTRADLEQILGTHWKLNELLYVLDDFFPPPAAWSDIAGAIDAAIPTFVAAFAPGSVQRSVAEDFIRRFEDHAKQRGSEKYSGEVFTVVGEGLTGLFSYQLALLGTDLGKIAADEREKKRVSSNLAVILNALRKVKAAEVVHENRRYIVSLNIPEVGSGRRTHSYQASMRVDPGQLFDATVTRAITHEREQLYATLHDYWFDGAVAWTRVGEALGSWMRLALDQHDPKRVVTLLREIMRTLDRVQRVLFLNGLTDFSVDPALVRDSTFSADYIQEAWQTSGGHVTHSDALSAAIVQKLRDHAGLDILEKAFALRLLLIWGSECLTAFAPGLPTPTTAPDDKDLIANTTAQAIAAMHIDLRTWFRDADAWLNSPRSK